MKNKLLDTKLLRSVAGSFATGITVICVEDHEGKVHGMTANSFQSVSLDPPLVMFSVMQHNAILDYLTISKKVGISILSEEQRDISVQFSGMSEDELDVGFEKENGFEIIKGCLAWYHTTVFEIISTGDHLLILCEVKNLGKSSGDPLIYFSGYRKVGSYI